jgi:hypothetical protein
MYCLSSGMTQRSGKTFMEDRYDRAERFFHELDAIGCEFGSIPQDLEEKYIQIPSLSKRIFLILTIPFSSFTFQSRRKR